jgi:hypothetical protein
MEAVVKILETRRGKRPRQIVQKRCHSMAVPARRVQSFRGDSLLERGDLASTWSKRFDSSLGALDGMPGL